MRFEVACQLLDNTLLPLTDIAESNTGGCQTAGVDGKINLGRRKAAVWSKLLSFEKKS
jgi:hypothetical protein